jgi:hypothetical protein
MIEKISNFPDPMPSNDNHYMSFEDIYGKETDEKHRPSLKTNLITILLILMIHN